MEQAIKNQHLRLAKIEPSERTMEMIQVLKREDVDEFKIDYEAKQDKPSIGFNRPNQA
ncbi:MAG: hypothetical protein ACK574_00385 [Bacteroidota bacterium]